VYEKVENSYSIKKEASHKMWFVVTYKNSAVRHQVTPPNLFGAGRAGEVLNFTNNFPEI
jgi:hypothetical protein